MRCVPNQSPFSIFLLYVCAVYASCVCVILECVIRVIKLAHHIWVGGWLGGRLSVRVCVALRCVV